MHPVRRPRCVDHLAQFGLHRAFAHKAKRTSGRCRRMRSATCTNLSGPFSQARRPTKPTRVASDGTPTTRGMPPRSARRESLGIDAVGNNLTVSAGARRQGLRVGLLADHDQVVPVSRATLISCVHKVRAWIVEITGVLVIRPATPASVCALEDERGSGRCDADGQLDRHLDRAPGGIILDRRDIDLEPCRRSDAVNALS